jgi:NagD protein
MMYFVDVQGTLIEDNTKLPTRGAVAFIDHLNSHQIPYMVITNSTKNPSDEFLGYLNSIGLNIPKEHYLDPLMMLESHIDKSKKIAAYGSEPFLKVIRAMGYILDFSSPDVVLVAIKENFTPDEYAQMIEFLLAGSELIGMHETTLYAKNHKRYPGVGAILKMLEFATSASYTVVGKPSKAFFEEALSRLQRQKESAGFGEITIISDDVKGDLIGAQRLGMKGIFVLSGKYRSADEIIPSLKPDERPAEIYHDMQGILESV